MKYLPKLQQLRIFHEVIRCGSIRAAARALNQSQPALTRALRELEQTLGATLLVRSNNGITLTESGRAFAVRMRLILEELGRAANEIEQINQSSQGSVAFGISSLLAVTILSSVLNDFKKDLPQAGIAIKEAQLSTLLSALREGQLDFAIGTIAPTVPVAEFVIEPLFVAPFGVVARIGHPLAHCRSLVQLKEARWFMPETDMGYYQQIEQQILCGVSDMSQAPVRSDSCICGLQLVLHEDYLTVLSLARVASDDFNQRLGIIPVQDRLPDAVYSLIYARSRPLTHTAQKMADLVCHHVQRYNWHPAPRYC
ncbi:LysR substrate-binding domain-containing protein [Brenneria tiliae]|uniref:LysR substrate-binding domain-containing protein n=1 Tax=Brenneria tiliae TaxID=2914984 RepID=A0ABT0MUY8_9GAMM|nr:LysR substrate-binding domain-containing protein [Brenneria tiliae]MCL2893592.1 LysR substrate-binding domain-containing protein [Brenneria tiliae]MCL2899259.1 LysR substrate-binding domain-containing protein [Brenneria tiliae]MCL2903637.1 LysR substrate-binding domain-containing protein [Brenneria tiliae]